MVLQFFKNLGLFARFLSDLSIQVFEGGKVVIKHPCGIVLHYTPAHYEDNRINELYFTYKGVFRQASSILSLQDDGVRHWQLPQEYLEADRDLHNEFRDETASKVKSVNRS